MDVTQQPDASVVSTDQKASFKKPIIFILLIVIIASIFGIYKIIDISHKSSTSQKLVSPYQKQIDQLDSLMVSINSLSSPLSPRISQEQFEQDKKGIASEIQRVKDELAKGNVEEARKIIRRTETTGTTTAISGLLNSIVNLGDPLQSKFVPQELKQKHDPMDKYIQKERVDPRIIDIYLKVIDVLVSIDKFY